MNKSLIYVHDPMCSWCWGFEPVRKQLFAAIEPDMPIQRLVGGLAPDSNEPMPTDMQQFLQATWHKISQTIPCTKFNFDFWSQCQPRRSTYPSNRAVIAARMQGEAFDSLMSQRIQQGYYLEATNPSDLSSLTAFAQDIGLNVAQFEQDMASKALATVFEQEVALTRRLGMNSFPSLALQINDKVYGIGLDYINAETMIRQIREIEQQHAESCD